MSAHPGQSGSAVPARLSFLAIYNPSLGITDDTLHDQIVFYWSRKDNANKRRGDINADEGVERSEDRNEKLRRIGLAQGMVEFARQAYSTWVLVRRTDLAGSYRSFSENKAVGSVETEKSRIVLHELEPGWWILASIDLTRLPSNGPSTQTNRTSTQPVTQSAEYSAREVSSPPLLIEHLRRAHAGFLLHHASSLSELYSCVDRSGFCGNLQRYWNRYVWNWDVLLHGNPSLDIFGAIKLAGGGELGMGVGEEDRGSGEREVLEGFVGRIEGLIDLVVSKFGEPPSESEGGIDNTDGKRKEQNQNPNAQPWGGPGSLPSPTDGVIFLGVGAIARTSLREIANWMEELYEYGEDTYGVNENSTSARRRKQRKIRAKASPKLERKGGRNALTQQKQPARTKNGAIVGEERNTGDALGSSQCRVPPPLIPTVESPAPQDIREDRNKLQGKQGDDSMGYGTGNFMKYLTLGYRSPWSTPSESKSGKDDGDPEIQIVEEVDEEQASLASIQHIDPQPDTEEEPEVFIQRREKTVGYFLVGLRGDVEDEEDEAMSSEQNPSEGGNSRRILVRTVQVEMQPTPYKGKETSLQDSPNRLSKQSISETSTSDPHKRKKCRVVVPLLSSTSPSTSLALHTATTALVRGSQQIHDLIYDPKSLTICSSIPNIPFPALVEGRGTYPDIWTRVEALNVHQQVLNIISSTRHQSPTLERTCKTSRGWWIVWMLLPNPKHDSVDNENDNYCSHQQQHREAILVRKSNDYVPRRIASLSSYGKDGAVGGSDVVGLAEGIGFNTRKYIESLLSLNR
ncbi:hypothetical protein FGG08_001179 [Glutinoglossum americanum]|uniref:CCZ1/INTU/HSP4 first Longin domain-containing protein n=1 Tax=Glutinoglossum americanum TaxID=1670608 RepID=A0A9P8I7H3_9PEZI|nr:hypothetical protein FGG08_001179 [Glutinoglossum americanum]